MKPMCPTSMLNKGSSWLKKFFFAPLSVFFSGNYFPCFCMGMLAGAVTFLLIPSTRQCYSTKLRSARPHTIKSIYWQGILVKESTGFIAGRQARSSGQLVLRKPKLPSKVQESIFKAQVRKEVCRVCDRVVHNALISHWWGNIVMSQELTLSVLRL